MKYYFLLFLSILFLLGGSSMTFFLWNVENSWKSKLFLALIPIFFIYLVIKYLQIYSKVKQNKNIVEVSKFFSKKTYDLNDLTSWDEQSNSIRVNYRALCITFPNEKLRIIDHADPDKIADLYHYLRIHYKDKMI